MTESSRTGTPLQQLNDYLFRQVDVVGQQGNNKRIHCKKCKHNFNGHAGRIHDHLISKALAVRGSIFFRDLGLHTLCIPSGKAPYRLGTAFGSTCKQIVLVTTLITGDKRLFLCLHWAAHVSCNAPFMIVMPQTLMLLQLELGFTV